MKRLVFLFLLTSFCFPFLSKASHVAGGTIQYTYLGPGTTTGTKSYKIRMGIIRDCNGIAYTTTFETLTAYCTATRATSTFTANKINYVAQPGERPTNNGARDISDICSSKSSRCVAAGNPGGYEIIYYEATLNLASCADYQIYVQQTQCCRNVMASSTGNTSSPHAAINTMNVTSSGPQFTLDSRPVASACVGQEVNYGIGAYDPDGDSLVYRMVPARVSQNGAVITYVSYTGGATFQKPIPNANFKLDAVNGGISFKTSLSGKFLAAVEILEYQRCNQQLKGRTYHEIQFDIRSCTNNVPALKAQFGNLSPNAVKSGPLSIETCAGNVITWNDTIEDRDVFDKLKFNSNISAVFPNGSYKITSLATNKAVVKWTLDTKGSPHGVGNFYLSYTDDRCDFPGTGFSFYSVSINPGLSLQDTFKVCKGDTAFINAQIGSGVVWTSIAGDPLVPNVNWFPKLNGQDVKFLPSRNTTLVAQMQNSSYCGRPSFISCNATDTIYVSLVDSFNINGVSSETFCHPAAGSLNVTPTKSGSYTYKWDNAGSLSSDTVKNPNFSGVKVDTKFTVTVTSSTGCAKTFTSEVKVTAPFPTNFKLNVDDTLICNNQRVNLWVTYNPPTYQEKCITGTTKCNGTYQYKTLGSGSYSNPSTTGSRTYPMTYNNTVLGMKSLYLYRASELRAMGMKAGPINSIGFELASATVISLSGLKIKIGCTSLNALGSTFPNVPYEVVNQSSYTPVPGWNTHSFQTPYFWDGTSNLIVQVCWDNATFYGVSCVQKFDQLSYNASAHNYRLNSFSPAACGATSSTAGVQTNMRPRTRFGACSGFNKSSVKYDWFPKTSGSYVSTPTADSAESILTSSSSPKYWVIVSDNSGKCRDSLGVKFSVVSKYNVTPVNPGPLCVDSITKLQAATPPNITTQGGRWTGKGIVDTINGFWDSRLAGLGKHWVKYEIKGDACANADSIQLSIFPRPNVNISTQKICEDYGHSLLDTSISKLIPTVPGGYFSGFGVDSIRDGSGKMLYYVNGSMFNPTNGKPDTAYISYARTFVCYADTTIKIPVVSPWDATYRGVDYHGTPYLTSSFCISGDHDTLNVAGPNPVWKLHNHPNAMADTSRGIIDPRMVVSSDGFDVKDTITVGNYGWCGNDTSFAVSFVLPPEVEVLNRVYCTDYVQENRNTIDTIFFRIPKGTQLGGSGKKTLDPAGFDPNNEVMLTYATVSSSGWPEAYMGVNQFNHHLWHSTSWLNNPSLARYQLKSIPKGKNAVVYQFAYNVRNIGPSTFSDLCYSRDTGYVDLADSIDVGLASYHELCDNETAVLAPRHYNNASYEWNTGSTQSSILVNTPGTYTVTVVSNGCSNTASTTVAWCTSVKESLAEGLKLNVYPNPTSSVLNVQLEGDFSGKSTLRLIGTNGQVVLEREVSKRELSSGLSLDLQRLQSGVYFLHLNNLDNTVTYQVVVK